MRRRVRLSAAEARRIALAAQDLHRERPACAPDVRHLRRVMQALKVLQLDFVNVLVPAHYLILWSRLGAYDRQRFDRFVYGKGDYTEQWAHEASIVPSDAWPLLAHRRAAYEPSKHNPLHKLRDRDRYLDVVLEQVRCDGALCAAARRLGAARSAVRCGSAAVARAEAEAGRLASIVTAMGARVSLWTRRSGGVAPLVQFSASL